MGAPQYILDIDRTLKHGHLVLEWDKESDILYESYIGLEPHKYKEYGTALTKR